MRMFIKKRRDLLHHVQNLAAVFDLIFLIMSVVGRGGLEVRTREVTEVRASDWDGVEGACHWELAPSSLVT